jgi:predicted aspartyl protease
MIRGFFHEEGGRRRPFITAHLAIPSQSASGDVEFLVDTGADSTVLAPADAIFLGLDVARFRRGTPSTGVGGTIGTAFTDATLTLDDLTYDLPLRLLVPTTRAQGRALFRLPSLLGRDFLSHFALFMEERSRRVILLESHEVASLRLP